MIGAGAFISFMHANNFMCKRKCLLNFYKNISKKALNDIEKSILPPKPKKPLAAFLLYVKDTKAKFIEEEPNITYKDILKKASQKWALLDPIEKKSFQEQYIKHYEMYVDKLNIYKNSLTDNQKQIWEDKKKEYLLNSKEIGSKLKSEMLCKPKRPLSGFLLYMLSKKSEKSSDTSHKEWLKYMGKTWKELPEINKEPYINKANKLWVEYIENLEKWEMEMIRLGHSDIVRAKILTQCKSKLNEEQ